MDTSADQAALDPLGPPQDIVATRQRQRILAATTELVAKRGYRGTSIDQIVKAARVGYPAFYQLFEGKEQCFCAAFDLIVADARERITHSLDLAAPWPEQVCAALHSLLELIAAEPFRARIVLTEAHTAGEAALRRHDALLDQVALLLRQGRSLRPGASEPPPTLEEAAVGGIVWLLSQRVVMGELQSVVQLFPELALIVLEPYLGTAPARALIATQDAPSPASKEGSSQAL
jgi:AcrR family transcriptional regulator